MDLEITAVLGGGIRSMDMAENCGGFITRGDADARPAAAGAFLTGNALLGDLVKGRKVRIASR